MGVIGEIASLAFVLLVHFLGLWHWFRNLRNGTAQPFREAVRITSQWVSTGMVWLVFFLAATYFVLTEFRRWGLWAILGCAGFVVGVVVLYAWRGKPAASRR